MRIQRTDPTIIRRETIDTGQEEHVTPEALILHYLEPGEHFHVCMRLPDGSMIVSHKCSDRQTVEQAEVFFETHLPRWRAAWKEN